MTIEEAIEWLKDEYEHARCDECIEGEYVNALDLAIKALEQQPCEDAISREAVIGGLANIAKAKAKSDAQKSMMGRCMFFVEQLSPVTPQRPKGKWIEIEVHNCHATLKCSVCNRVIEPTFTLGEYSYEDIKTFYPYCHCGAYMSGGEEDDLKT